MKRPHTLARMIVVACGAFVLGAIMNLALEACGNWSQPVFVHTLFPDHGHFEAFAKGDLGLLQPTFARSYLVVAYRHLSGVGMDAEAQDGALKLWWEREGYGPERKTEQRSYSFDQSGRDQWKSARRVVIEGKPELASPYEWDESYVATSRITESVYRKASEILDARVKDHGAKDPWVLAWVKGQDLIFSGEKVRVLPETAHPVAPQWFKQDRDYQIAAAEFHMGHLAKASALFAAISKDQTSPWCDLSAYLVARASLREAGKDPAKLSELNQYLKKLLKNPKRAAIHTDVKAMMDRVAFLSDPADYLSTLGSRLSAKGKVASFHEALDNYTYAWDRITGYDEQAAPSVTPMTPVGESMSDWIRVFSGASGDALAQWRQTPSLPWLVASLVYAGGKDDSLDDLLDSAAKVDSKNPAYLTVTFHRIRLKFEQGKASEAESLMADLQKRPNLPPTLFNLLRQMQQKEAKDLKTWLKFLPQKVAGISEGTRKTYPVVQENEEPDPVEVERIKTSIPAEVLRDAALDLESPKVLGLGRIALEKALLLGREDLVRTLHKRDPKKLDDVDHWLAEKDPDTREFVLALRAGHRRDRDCFPKAKFGPMELLSEADAEIVTKEQQVIESLGPSVDFHCKNILSYAEAHPKDSRVPEALHLAVQLTRTNSGCGSEEKTKLSKRAFQLLHKRFPKTDWAKKTPVHY